MKPEESFRLVVLLGALISLPALGTDLFVPALADVADTLGAEVGGTQLTVTAYFAGIACGQLVWGPLSDRFGRKPVLFTGLGVMLASSVAAAAGGTVAAVAAARLAQGFGMSSGALIGRTIVRDLYAHEQAARLLARMTIVFSLVPLLAPVLGALLVGLAGWRAVLLAMAAAAAVLLFSATRLAETAPAERRSVHPAAIGRTFAAILADRRFLAPFSVVLCAHIGILTWVSSSSFTLVRGLGLAPLAFGLLFALVMLGQIGGAWASSRLVVRIGMGRLLAAGTWLMALSGLAAAAGAWLGLAHWAALVVPFMVFLFGTALVLPSATAAALSPFPHSAGTASSIIGAVGFTCGALLSSGLGAAFDGTPRPMATLAALAGVAALLLRRMAFRGSR